MLMEVKEHTHSIQMALSGLLTVIGWGHLAGFPIAKISSLYLESMQRQLRDKLLKIIS